MTSTATSVGAFEPHFANLETLPEPFFARDLRARARLDFERLGLPSQRLEDWRFTSVKAIAATEFSTNPPVEPPQALDERRIEGAHQIVVVNGRFSQQASRISDLPAGISIHAVSRRDDDWPAIVADHLGQVANFEDHAFRALNTALFEDLLVVHASAGAECTAPIQLLFANSSAGDQPAVNYPRVLVVAETASTLTVAESHFGEGCYLSCPLTEMSLASSAVIEHAVLVDHDDEASQLASMAARLGDDARLTSHAMSFGGALVRNEFRALVEGERADATLNGLYVAEQNQHVDHQLRVDHVAPNSTSDQLYKGILADTSRAVFTGRIFVDQKAQRIDAGQANHNLLLSDTAMVNSNPQLEIFADDVRCSHGSTVGRLDDEALFYMRSRGIPQEQAKRMLIHAFAADVAERVVSTEVRGDLEARLERRLADLDDRGEGLS